MKEELSRSLPGEQKDQLDSLVSGMDEQYQAQLEDMHRQHVVRFLQSETTNILPGQIKINRTTLSFSYFHKMWLGNPEIY